MRGYASRQRKVSAGKARAIIALSPDGMPPDAADARMIRIIMSIKVPLHPLFLEIQEMHAIQISVSAFSANKLFSTMLLVHFHFK